MPAWWPRKSKSKSKPKKSESASCSSSPHPRTDENTILKTSSNDKKEKANSFDETVARKAAAAVSNDHDQVFAFGQHPLPRPLSSPLPSVSREILVLGSGSVSASESSVSSSGSEETPDLTFYRYAATINVPKGNGLASEHPRSISVSPRKEYNHQTTSENIFSSVHVMRGNTRPTSPMHPKSVGVCPGSPNMCPSSPKLRHEEMKSPPHPLPLPPSSPGSSSRSNSCTQLNPSQWKKGKLLGRGTFGHVYTGFNRENGQMCAIKEVKVISDDSNSKECLRQLNQEITLLSQLSHPNIVQYHGSELVDDTLSVYLEYVSGGSIHKLLQEYGPFGEPVIRSYARQILSGLAYLHGRNTVHRDIKGANILVDPNGEVKLADFGMAKHISAYTSIRSFKGSPYWMAPEVIMNGNGYNLSVDIWSLGCTVLEMATSKPPWSQFEGVAAIFKIGNSKDIPEIPDHLSSDAKSFLKLCLQRDPAGRPTAIQLMDHPFVRDQPSNKATKLNVFRDSLPSISAETQRLGAMDLSPNRSLSPLRDNNYRVGHLVEFPSSSRNQSDLQSMRMNMSLPVSPCSSPLRQVNNQYTRSCLPSPPHPAYSANAVNYGPSNYALYPSKHGSSMFDAWQEVPQLRAQSAYGSPRR